MEFIKEIRLLENTTKRKEDYMTSLGSTEVLLSTLELAKSNDHYVEDEFLKAITRYVASYTDSSYFIKLRETSDDNLQKLQEYIDQNAIKLLIDINVTTDNNNDIVIKPINKNIDKTIIKELKEALEEENITKITVILDVKSKTPMKSMYKEFQAFKGVESISIQEFNEG